MKKMLKMAVNLMAVVLIAVCTFGLSACEDIKQLDITVQVYDHADSSFYAESDVKFTVDLYRHLAHKTVDKVIEYVNAGYYDNVVFYQNTSENSAIFVGDLKFVDGELQENRINGKLPSEMYGEFEYNGTTGSNLVNQKGSIAIWRSYYEQDDGLTTSSDARNSGRATWLIPTATKASYDGNVCVFAQYDKENTANAKAISAISMIFSDTSYYTEYVIYYTGEYDEAKADDNYGLTFRAVKADDFDDDTEVFTAEGKQLVCYNKKTVRIPNAVDGESSAKIKSVKVK